MLQKKKKTFTVNDYLCAIKYVNYIDKAGGGRGSLEENREFRSDDRHSACIVLYRQVLSISLHNRRLFRGREKTIAILFSPRPYCFPAPVT